MLLYYLVITLLLGLTSLASYYSAQTLISRLTNIFIDYVYLNNLYTEITALESTVERYLGSKSSEALLEYYNLNNKLQEQASQLSQLKGYDKNTLMLKDIGNMMDNLLQEADAAVNAKRGRMGGVYLVHFTESHKIAGYIKTYINELLYNKLQEGSQKYESIKGHMVLLSYLNFFLIIGLLLSSILLAIYFTYKITRPIIELSRSAERISRGDFGVEPVNIQGETEDEVRILAEAFNRMAVSIKNYIDKIKYQAEMEKRLKEQEMQNLMMKNLLKDARLKSLQSQINPHFLFNTLNAASQLAMMEGAEKSALFIEKVADLFRYNLKRLDKPVTLRDEIRHVENYMYILKTRFGDKIDFYLDIEDSVLDLEIPCTVIQPVVENAFLHGIEKMEGPGKIALKVKKQDGYVAIEVEDNGVGMEDHVIRSILKVELADGGREGHVSGIGMHNVINRLMLFYNVEEAQDIIEIYSQKGAGTKVILKIPLKEDRRIVQS